jgi:hypothetical protein
MVGSLVGFEGVLCRNLQKPLVDDITRACTNLYYKVTAIALVSAFTAKDGGGHG